MWLFRGGGTGRNVLVKEKKVREEQVDQPLIQVLPSHSLNILYFHNTLGKIVFIALLSTKKLNNAEELP